MATAVIPWTTGNGNITLTYTGQGNGTIVVKSDDNDGVARQQTLTVSGGGVTQQVTVRQDAIPALEYLTIKSRVDNNVIGWKYVGSSVAKTIEVSTDKTTWTSKTSTTDGVTLATLNTGDKLYVRGSNTQYATDSSVYNCFTSTGNFDVLGNIMSLLYGDNFASQTSLPATYTFTGLFRSCTGLINAKNLILPATTLQGRCYYGLFLGCTDLLTAPEFPATTLETYCYYNAFSGCTSLETVPDLPATTLATYCYYRMYRGCTSLTTAPKLPAKTLLTNSYREMFYGCSKLNNVTMLATNISASNCLNNWLYSVAATGTLVKDASMTTLPSGASGIPTGWVTDDYGKDYSAEYFTIRSRVANNVIRLKYTGSSMAKTIEVSTDKTTWTSKTSTAEGVALATLNIGDRLYIRGSNTRYGTGSSNFNNFTSTGNIDVEGNIMSLLYGDNFASQTELSATYTFVKLFDSCKIINAKNLILPATTLKGRCYFGLFVRCTSLISAPALPATTFAINCYYRTFSTCTSLTTAPVLAAPVLGEGCYYQTFMDCSSLNHVTMLATDISATDCLHGWLSGVAASGTFVKSASMTTLPSGASGIPTGWTVVDN